MWRTILYYLSQFSLEILAPLPAESDTESVVEEQSTPKPTTPSAQAKEELHDAVMEEVKPKEADVDEEEESDDVDEDGESVAGSSLAS